MKKTLFYIFTIFFLNSCSEVENWVDSEDAKNAVELTGVEAFVYGSEKTRAAALDKENYVGRSAFIHQDQMVLTTIKRTPQPNATPPVGVISGFSYKGIVYNHEVATGQTAGGWNRDESKGKTEESNNVPEKIYWSDASNCHTYIGYSLPQQTAGVTFDWNMINTYDATATAGLDTYYGSLGDPTVPQTETDGVISNYIDYTNAPDDNNPVAEIGNNGQPTGAVSYKSGNEKIKHDDLLLTFDDEKLAEPGGSVAKLYYHHALANVRVVVNISGFSATSESADARSIVKNMVLKNMLTMYKWKQQSNGAEALNETYDKPKLKDIYNNLPDGHSVPEYNQKKDVHMWIPRKAGTGSGVGKQFVFYALAVPTTMVANELVMKFDVEYQDPMEPWTDNEHTQANMKTHPYTATMPQDIVFRAGWCTTINISLNHNNEEMTVGAEYMDWEFDPSPDEGELKKNSTLLQGTDRHRVTIFGDGSQVQGQISADADDATWLYVDSQNNNELRDIYGNDGSAEHPFIISTEAQLLSFAHEVKGTNRTKVTINKKIADASGKKPGETGYIPTHEELEIGGGFDFKDYHIKLDADITLQKSMTSESDFLEWIGIGGDEKDSEGNYINAFNGYFNGGFRHINRLYGAPFFNTIGKYGIVDHIFITNAISIKGSGSIAERNEGIICGSHVEGDIYDETHTDVCGSIVGVNSGVLIACSHIGKITGNSDILGALLGKNDGIMVSCYNVGDAQNIASGKPAYAGVGDYTSRSVAYCCYFNKDFYTSQDYANLTAEGTIGHVAFPLSTLEMQSDKYVNYPCVEDPETHKLSGEITDVREKTDPFYWHWSLNVGLERAIKYLEDTLGQTPDIQNDIQFHAPGTNDTDVEVSRVTLKNSQVQWLVNHFSGNSHQFLFSPGTYPKLK